MNGILYLVHAGADGALPKVALEGLSAALDLRGGDGSLTIGLIGDQVQQLADRIATCGADRFLAAEGPELAASRYASDAAAIEALVNASEASVVLAPATSRFARVLPGAAQRCGGRVDTQATAIRADGDEVEIERWYYRQRMVAKLRRRHRPWFVLLAAGAFPAWSGEPGTADVSRVALAQGDAPARTQVVGLRAGGADAETIRPDADLLFVAGAGWTKKQPDGQPHVAEAEEHILTFLAQTKASLGSSKSLVDLGAEGGQAMRFLTQMNQVGQTGSTPRHPKGLATCCHGEEPHVVGWRFIQERRAINRDPNCGWAQGKADVLYVADAFAVMAKVNERLRSG